ncbi:MAG: hypothetical protein HOQ24_17840, partial [Mycobacteriaceae bacterium]|nr:hypothetical protein [Mycobacteriaceae bacterium]
MGTVAAAAAVLAITSWSAPGQAGAARPCTPSPAGLIFGCGGPVVAPGDPVIADGACSVGLTGHIGAAEYAVTAGHCFHAGAQVKDATGKPIGWYEFGRPDLGHTDQFGFALIHLYDNVFTSAGTPTYHLAAIDTKPTVGQQICKEGRTTRKTCGHITEVSAEHIFADSLFDNPGDTGGVVYRAAAAGQVWLG